jgi:hypothetical protein
MDSRSLETFDPETPAGEEIAARAYARYLERGAVDGFDVDDWLEAERELREERRSRWSADAEDAA